MSPAPPPEKWTCPTFAFPSPPPDLNPASARQLRTAELSFFHCRYRRVTERNRESQRGSFREQENIISRSEGSLGNNGNLSQRCNLAELKGLNIIGRKFDFFQGAITGTVNTARRSNTRKRRSQSHSLFS